MEEQTLSCTANDMNSFLHLTRSRGVNRRSRRAGGLGFNAHGNHRQEHKRHDPGRDSSGYNGAGYECQEADGDFMLVFANPVEAVNFCLQVIAPPQSLQITSRLSRAMCPRLCSCRDWVLHPNAGCHGEQITDAARPCMRSTWPTIMRSHDDQSSALLHTVGMLDYSATHPHGFDLFQPQDCEACGCLIGTRGTAGSSLGAQCASAAALLPCPGTDRQSAVLWAPCSNGNL